jgi:DNA-directed RNA polymerase subunit E'/Rpb7
MNSVCLEKNIYIAPAFLTSNIKKTIKDKLNTELINKCDRDYGYITYIKDIEIVHNSISPTGSGAFFYVKFKADIIRPEIGKEYNGNICMIFSNGIFVEMVGKMKVLIPVNKTNGYLYDKGESCFKKGSDLLKKDQNVKVKIDMIKYEKGNFSCIGSLT